MMKKIFISMLLMVVSLYAIDIDYKTLEEIVSNDDHAINERILLAKYYDKNNNDLKAKNLLQEVLAIDPKNVNALHIKKLIQRKEHAKTLFREAGLSTPIVAQEAEKRLDSYYKANNYQFYSNLYQALVDADVELKDSYHIKAAYIYLWDADYNHSEDALARLKQKNNLDAGKIRADICYYTGKYNCSVASYEKLYNTTYDIQTGIKLINSYIYLGEIQKAQRLQGYLLRKNPNNVEVVKLGKKILDLKDGYLEKIEKKYNTTPNQTTLTRYVSALYSANKKVKALATLKEYNQKHQTKESLLLEAKYLAWEGKTQEALKILNLESLENNLSAKLMLGKIYSWDEYYKEAEEQLKYVLEHSKDKKQLFEANNALGHIYLWNKQNKKAKEIFLILQKEQPQNTEVNEALMQLNNDYSGLQKIYEVKVKKGNNANDIKYLAELYTLTKNKTKAIEMLEKYLQNNPNDLEATKALGLLLVDQKKYYKGFGYLEYYAAEKRTSASQLLLAKNYYWQGFSKEALDILDNIIANERKDKSKDISLVENIEGDTDLKKALKLKAEILKIAPRFTTSNTGATVQSYYDDLGKKQLFLADTLYFNSHYKASLIYYENYLKNHPNDHKARYRYAFSLENAKKYGKAEGEFSLIFWTKNNEELRYHYAYNMMKNGKLDESKKLLEKLQETAYKKLDANLTTFLNRWKERWESLNYNKYALSYSEKFTNDKKWAYRKQSIFSNVSFISLDIYDPISKKLGNNRYKIRFYQKYATNKKTDEGYKTLEVECKAKNKECKIVKESWEAGKYEKYLLLTPYIEKSLKENQDLKTRPLAFRSKKKTLLRSLTNIMIFT